MSDIERAAREPSDTELAKVLLNDIAPYLGIRGMAHFANAAVLAAHRLEAIRALNPKEDQ